MPSAVNCSVVPASGVVEGPVTAMEVSVAEATVTAMLPETPFMLAVMVTAPAFTAVTRPLESTVTSDVSEAFQVTCELRVACVPSL